VGDNTKLVNVACVESNSETSFKLAYVFRVLLPDLTDIVINVHIVYITNLRNTWESHHLHPIVLHDKIYLNLIYCLSGNVGV
jgi:hypothetical protein